MKREHFDGHPGIRKTLWNSQDCVWVWVWCTFMCVCDGSYMSQRLRGQGKSLQSHWVFHLYSVFFSIFLPDSKKIIMLWHRYPSTPEGLWLTEAASQVFSWPFLSHALLWLVAFNRLWPLFMSKGITGWAVSPFLFPSELACLPHVWFRK